jgi:hypothetical protein
MKIIDRILLTLCLIGTAGPALADPTTLIIAALQASGVTVSAFGAAAIRLGVGLAYSALASALSSPANANGAPKGIVLRSTTAGEQVPQSFILGRYVTAGNLAAPEMSHGTGGDTRYLTRVIDLSDVQVDSLESLIINGVRCELATGSPATLTMTHGDGTTPAIHPDYGPTVNKGDFIGFAWCRFRNGSQNTVDPMLSAKYGNYPERPWTSNMVGRGVAQAIMTFLWRDSPQVWQGRPDVRFVVKGIRLYDPRLDSTAGGSGPHRYDNTATHAWSENPVVMIYNILRGIQILGGHKFGGGFTAADLPYANWAAAMNACDVMIGDRKTYVAGLEVFMGGSDAGGSSPADAIEELLKACSGQIADVGGTLYIRVGAPGLPVKFITDDDVLVSQPQELDPFPGAQDSYNIVHATWMSPGNLWTPHEATPRRDEDAITADGQELPAHLSLPAVTVPGQVQQQMAAWLKDAQRYRRQTITLPPEGILLKPLDVIDWTSTRNGYSGKDFEIGQVAIDPLTLCTTLAMREVDPDDYDWQVGDDIAVTAPSIEPVVPSPVTVPGFTAIATTIKDGTGTDRRPAIRLQWNIPLPGVSSIRFQIRVLSGATVAVEGSTANVDVGYHVVSEGIVSNVQYQARARLVGPKTTEWTAWVTVTAPNVGITEDDFQGSIEEVFLNAGLVPIEIVDSLPQTGNFVGRTVYLTTDNKLYRWDGTQWTAAVETVDLVGQIVADQVADGAINTAKFATGIAPVEIVNALPETGNFEGRTVYLTTDNKLYRHTGSPSGAAGFTAAVPAVDVTGQLTDAQIADIAAAKLTGQITGPQIADLAVTADKIADQAINTAKFASGIAPVEIVTALPNTGNFEGRTVYLTTDDKLYRHTGSPSGSAGFTAAVPAVDVTGQLTNAQIADLAAAKLTGQITASQIADGAINTAKFATGIAPVEIVTALPNTGNFEGRTVYLTTDDKLYRHTGSPAGSAGFTRSTDGADILANSITAGKIAAGAISATEIASGAITTDKLAVGSGTNTIHNAQFYGGLSGWHATAVSGNTGVMSIRSGTSWTKPGGPVLEVFQPDAGTLGYVDVRPERVGETGATRFGWPVTAGETWEASAGVSAHRCTVDVRIEWRDVAGTVLSYTGPVSNAANTHSSVDPDLWPRLVVRGTAPTGAAYAVLHLRKNATSSGTNSYMMVYKPLLGRTVAQATEPLQWSPGGYTLVTGDTILTGSIQAANIAANAITAGKIATGAVTADKIDANAVTSAKLAAGAVTADTIAANAITTPKIEAGAITTSKIATQAITAEKIAADSITAGQIAAGAISTSELAAGAVNADKLAANAVTADKIAANAITAGKIATDAVTSDKIAANSITSNKIAANAITAGLIAAGAISGDLGHIANLSVDTLQIKGQAVTVPVRVFRGPRVELTNTSWVRVASLSIPRTAGFQTLFTIGFGYDADGEQTVRVRILRGSTQIFACSTTTPRGSQMQAGFPAIDANTQSGNTTYHLEVARGTNAGNTFQANVWNVFFEAMQVLR